MNNIAGSFHKDSEKINCSLQKLLKAADRGNLQEIGGKLQDLQSCLHSLRQSVSNLQGSELSQTEQIRYILRLEEEIELKNQLISKYKQLGLTVLDVSE